MLFNDLRGITVAVGATPQDEVVFLDGGEFLADAKGGFFAWDGASTDAESNDIIKPNSLTLAQAGRWRRVRYIPAYGTTVGTVCEGNDGRIPNTTALSFLSMITMSGDDFTLTPPGAGKIIVTGELRVEGQIVIFDGVNTRTLTATSG